MCWCVLLNLLLATGVGPGANVFVAKGRGLASVCDGRTVDVNGVVGWMVWMSEKEKKRSLLPFSSFLPRGAPEQDWAVTKQFPIIFFIRKRIGENIKKKPMFCYGLCKLDHVDMRQQPARKQSQKNC